MCIGKYGDIPNMPAFPHGKGPEIFHGKVMHSLDYCKLDEEASKELMSGKKVAVIGYKKSAIDLAVECAEANQGKLHSKILKLSRSLNVFLGKKLVDFCVILNKMSILCLFLHNKQNLLGFLLQASTTCSKKI